MAGVDRHDVVPPHLAAAWFWTWATCVGATLLITTATIGACTPGWRQWLGRRK